MARWARPRSWPVVPLRLDRLVVSEWPGSPVQAYAAWRQARRDWCQVHGFRAVGGPYPDDRPEGPLGDVIDQLNAEGAARRQPGVWDDLVRMGERRLAGFSSG